MYHRTKHNSAGFTLVELLVVISIIGLLSTFAVVSLNSARIKSRDALRKGDMAQVRTALNVYYDAHGVYPYCDGANLDMEWEVADGLPVGGATLENGSICYRDVLGAALTAYPRPLLDRMPTDPKNEGNKLTADGGNDLYLYRYIANDDSYMMIYFLEEDGGVEPQIIRGW